MARPPLLLIACGETYRSGRASGVERVVRMIAQHASSVVGAHGMTAASVRIEESGIAVLDNDWLHERRGRDAPPAVSAMVQRLRWYSHRIMHASARPLRWVLPAKKVDELVYRDAADHMPVRWLRSLWRKRDKRLDWLDLRADQTGNILLLAEVTWTRREWPAVRQFRAKGGAVVVLIYDLIPILMPEHYSVAMQVHYRAWLDEQRRVASGFVAISATVASQLRDFLGDTDLPVRHALLGSDPIAVADVLPGDALPPGLVAPERHLFLVVGMLAPRKNHMFILDAFELYWAKGGTAALAIVANSAWASAAMLARLEVHKLLGKKLFYLTDADDHTLERLYAAASGLVFASRAEGFGLPLIEALQRGVPVLCSDIAVFHELADGWARFFSLDDPQALCVALEDFDKLHPPGQTFERKPMPWQGWQQSIDTMVDEIVQVGKSGRGTRSSRASAP